MATPPALEPMQALGDDVERRWRARHFDQACFHEVAAAALGAAGLSQRTSWTSLAEAFLRTPNPPPQFDPRFGDPQLTVYRHSLFYVEVLYWLHGQTAIHQHGFRGAFQVLAGASVHCRYHFRLERRISEALLLGQVDLADMELLTAGAIRPIDGPRLIHSLYHLERPTVTVVVRTPNSYDGPQYSYYPPHVAYDELTRDQTLEKQVLVLQLLRRLKDPSYRTVLDDLVASADLRTVFRVLKDGIEDLTTAGALEEVLARGRAAHGDALDRIAASLDEWLWGETTLRHLDDVPGDEHQFFLSLLLTLPARDPILRLIGARHPGPEQETVLRWVRELTTIAEDGSFEVLDLEVTHADTPHSAALGRRLPEVFFWYFGARLAHRSPQAITSELQGLVPSLTRSQAEELLASWEPLSSSAFRPLFR